MHYASDILADTSWAGWWNSQLHSGERLSRQQRRMLYASSDYQYANVSRPASKTACGEYVVAHVMQQELKSENGIGARSANMCRVTVGE